MINEGTPIIWIIISVYSTKIRRISSNTVFNSLNLSHSFSCTASETDSLHLFLYPNNEGCHFANRGRREVINIFT